MLPERVITLTKVGIITFLHNENYGSMLQAWALAQAVNSFGCEAMHLDYAPGTGEKIRNMLRCGNSPKLLLDGLRKRLVKAEQGQARGKAAALAAFRRESLPVSAPCHGAAELHAASQMCDVLLAGSDQIWSPTWLNPAYFLSFADADKPKLAYAPSFGVAEAPKGRKAHMMQALIAPFRSISVREEEGAKLLQTLTGRQAPVMPDPVFLVSADAWRSFAADSPVKGDYLLCYFIGENPSYWQQAQEVAKKRGLKMVILPATKEAWQQKGEKYGDVTPQAWVGLIAHAGAMVTDSFHGAAFAYLLGTSVTVMRRYNDQDPASRNSRIDQLHRNLGITQGETPTAEALEALRQRGLTWLRDALAQAGAEVPQAGEK